MAFDVLDELCAMHGFAVLIYARGEKPRIDGTPPADASAFLRLAWEADFSGLQLEVAPAGMSPLSRVLQFDEWTSELRLDLVEV